MARPTSWTPFDDKLSDGGYPVEPARGSVLGWTVGPTMQVAVRVDTGWLISGDDIVYTWLGLVGQFGDVDDWPKVGEVAVWGRLIEPAKTTRADGSADPLNLPDIDW